VRKEDTLRVTPVAHDLELGAPTEGYERSPGLHMSDIYSSLYREIDPDRYDKKDADGNPEPMDMLKIEMGTTFEEIFEPALQRRLLRDGKRAVRPPEHTVKVDGTTIFYSPDQFIFEKDKSLRLGEFKLTWYSNCGITDPKFDKWFTQMKAYAYHLDTPHARLYTLFVNGTYKVKGMKGKDAAPKPQLMAWDIEFTPRELKDNWNMLVRHARQKRML
jgi:hypothetical protein